MGKVFTEYQSKSGTIPYKTSTLCFCLTDYAKKYIKENRSAITNVSKDVRDAVLVDAINYLGSVGGSLFGLITKDLYTNEQKEEKVDAESLLTVLKNHYATYIFDCGVVDSVLNNKHMNNIQGRFDADDGVKVLVDFINYIAEVNGYDRIFTIKELYDKYKNQEYKFEMARLKEFLQKTEEYSSKLATGKNIYDIYINVLEQFNVSNISKDGKYYIDDEGKHLGWNKILIEREIYAMAYAYDKMYGETKEPTKIEILDAKILEMKNSKQKELSLMNNFTDEVEAV